MRSLMSVKLNGNNFTGSIAVELASIPQLQEFQVDTNQLTGESTRASISMVQSNFLLMALGTKKKAQLPQNLGV